VNTCAKELNKAQMAKSMMLRDKSISVSSLKVEEFGTAAKVAALSLSLSLARARSLSLSLYIYNIS
jgi:hypothetical protein